MAEDPYSLLPRRLLIALHMIVNRDDMARELGLSGEPLLPEDPTLADKQALFDWKTDYYNRLEDSQTVTFEKEWRIRFRWADAALRVMNEKNELIIDREFPVKSGSHGAIIAQEGHEPIFLKEHVCWFCARTIMDKEPELQVNTELGVRTCCDECHRQGTLKGRLICDCGELCSGVFKILNRPVCTKCHEVYQKHPRTTSREEGDREGKCWCCGKEGLPLAGWRTKYGSKQICHACLDSYDMLETCAVCFDKCSGAFKVPSAKQGLCFGCFHKLPRA